MGWGDPNLPLATRYVDSCVKKLEGAKNLKISFSDIHVPKWWWGNSF